MAIDTVDAVLGGDGLLQGLEHVILEVLGVFDTAADTYEVVKDTDGLALISGNAGVGHAAGNLYQTLDTAETLCKGEDLGDLAEALGSGVTALDAEGQHAAAHAITVLLLSDVAVGVRLKAGVVDSDDVGRGLEGVGNGGGIGGGLARAQVEGLEAAVGEPRVKGGGDSADGVLQEAEAVLELVAVEGGDAHDDVAVAIDILGDAMDDDVGAQVEGVLDVGREEGVVDDDEDAVLVRLGDDGADVDEAQGRVAGALDPDEAGLVGDVLADVDLDLGRKRHADAMGLGHLREVAVGAAVDVRHGDDMAARGEALEDRGRRGAAAGEGEGVLGVLEGRYGRLEVVAVGVRRPRVLVLADGTADRRLRKRRRERDGLNDGARGGVVGGSGVHGERSEGVHGGRRSRRRGHGIRVERHGRRHFFL